MPIPHTRGSATREDLLEAARALVPVLKQRAARTEELRQMPPETIADFRAAGFTRLINPPRFGGTHDGDLAFDITMELARGCGSSGWCYSVWAIHNWLIGHFPLQAQEEAFASGPDLLVCSGFAPSGRLSSAEGGYRLTGRWQFSSGCDAATWAIVGAMGERGPSFVLVPCADYEIVDTWFVAGLSGSGSKDLQVSEAFIPSHRTLSLDDLGRGLSPAWEMHARASYRLRGISGLSAAIVSPLVGMAQGALDEVIERATGAAAAQSVSLQMRIAEADAEIGAARTLVRSHVAELLSRAERDDVPDVAEQVRYRRDFAYASRLCVQAVERLYQGAGGSAVYSSVPLQRFFRDIHVASHHTALNWDTLSMQSGRAALGMAIEPPSLPTPRLPESK